MTQSGQAQAKEKIFFCKCIFDEEVLQLLQYNLFGRERSWEVQGESSDVHNKDNLRLFFLRAICSNIQCAYETCIHNFAATRIESKEHLDFLLPNTQNRSVQEDLTPPGSFCCLSFSFTLIERIGDGLNRTCLKLKG